MITICTSNRSVTCLYTCQRRCPVSLESLHWPTVWRLPVLSSPLPTFHFNCQTQKPPSISSPFSHCPFANFHVLLISFQDLFYFENDIYEEICEDEVEVSLSNSPSPPPVHHCTLVYVSASCYEYSSLYQFYSLLDHLSHSKSTCTFVNSRWQLSLLHLPNV